MPTAKPRITVTLQQRQHEVLTRLSAASGQSMSEIVAGFVEMATPSLERVVAIMERARQAPAEVKAGFRTALDRADREVVPVLLEALGQSDLFLEQMATEAEAATSTDRPAGAGRASTARPTAGTEARGKGRSAGLSTPGPVTRGSGRGETRPKGRDRG